jgi:putative transposase
VSAYPLIEAEKAEGGNVTKACALTEVSLSAHYESSKHRPSRRQLADTELMDEIGEVFDASKGTYGWPRVHAALRSAGVCAAANGWPGSWLRPASWATAGARRPAPPSPTRSQGARPYRAGLRPRIGAGPNLGERHYVRTWEGRLYLATVIDKAGPRRRVGHDRPHAARTGL